MLHTLWDCSFPTREGTRAPDRDSTESEPLDHQGTANKHSDDERK